MTQMKELMSKKVAKVPLKWIRSLSKVLECQQRPTTGAKRPTMKWIWSRKVLLVSELSD